MIIPMKRTIVTSLALVLVLVFAAISQTASHEHQVVIQMNSPAGDSWNQLYANIENIQKVFANDGIQIEVVFYGKGLSMLLKTNAPYEERMKKAAGTGVVLAACQNSMRIQKVKTEDLMPFAAQVDSGVAELIRKQEAGWSIVKVSE